MNESIGMLSDLASFSVPVTSVGTLYHALMNAMQTLANELFLEVDDEETRSKVSNVLSDILRDAKAQGVIVSWSVRCHRSNESRSFSATVSFKEFDHSPSRQWNFAIVVGPLKCEAAPEDKHRRRR